MAEVKPMRSVEDHMRAVFAIAGDRRLPQGVRSLAFDLYRILHTHRAPEVVQRMERERGLRG